MWVKAIKCLKCGGRLTYETIGSYGDLYDIDIRTGKPCKTRKKRIHYEHDDIMIYCSQCGNNYDFIQNDKDGSYLIGDYNYL